MPKFICITCGTQFPESDNEPDSCLICEDDRQYVRPGGQKWTTLEELLQQKYESACLCLEPNLFAFHTVPRFAIGENAYLIQTNEGNILWECYSILDDTTKALINGLGGIQKIAISHPHFFSTMNEWATAFDCKIITHEKNKEWVVNPTSHIEYWTGDSHKLSDDLTLYCLGGHFDGSSILHWSKGAENRGVVFSSDTLFVNMDLKSVTFLHSFPNSIPLPKSKIKIIHDMIMPIEFDRIYSVWSANSAALGGGTIIDKNAKTAVLQSTKRYIQALND